MLGLGLGFKFERKNFAGLALGLWRLKLGGSGEGRLMVIPGFGDSPFSWMGSIGLLIPTLRSRVGEIVMIDFPGFSGVLSKKPCAPDMDTLMGSVNECIDQLLPRVVIAHSLGGWLAGSYLVARGERAREMHFVIGSPSGVFGPELLKKQFKALFEEATLLGYDAIRPHVFGTEPLWLKPFLGFFNDFFQRKDILLWMQSIREDHELDGKLGSVCARVDLFWGDRDTLTFTQWAEYWKTGLSHLNPPSQLYFLHDTGHSPHLERPIVCAALLRQILGAEALPGEKYLARFTLQARETS